jgi:DNA-binding CsgD family transcriptional regulator
LDGSWRDHRIIQAGRGVAMRRGAVGKEPAGAAAAVDDCRQVIRPDDPLLRVVAQVKAAVPFDGYLAAGRPFHGLGSASGAVLACGCSDEVRDSYFQPGSAKSDPHIRALRDQARVLTTADISTIAQADSAMSRRLWGLGQAVGREAVAVPINYCGRDGGFVLFRRDRPFSPEEVEFLTLAAPALHGGASIDDLTPRERECLTWASQGKTAGEIGAVLGISEYTAVAHLNSAMAKLKVSSRAHAIAQALRLGLID